MKRRGVLLALCAVSFAVQAAEPPDYFENLRDRTYVELDQPYVVRQKSDPGDASPLFRVRHLLLRVKAGTGDAERKWWPIRSLFLIEAASGNRFVAEITVDTGDLGHRAAPKAWMRLSGSRNGAAVETWATSDWDADRDANPESQGPCGGTRYRILGGGLEIAGVDLGDGRTRTVSTTVSEIRDAVFTPEEIQDLLRLRELDTARLDNGNRDPVVANLSGSTRLAWMLLLMDRPPVPRAGQNLVLVPDAAPPGDLAAWRRLTYLPQDLPAFAALSAEGGVK